MPPTHDKKDAHESAAQKEAVLSTSSNNTKKISDLSTKVPVTKRKAYARNGDLICGRFWRWMLLVSRTFSHTIHKTSKEMFQTLLSKKLRAHIFVTSRFQHRFLLGERLALWVRVDS